MECNRTMINLCLFIIIIYYNTHSECYVKESKSVENENIESNITYSLLIIKRTS